jgi:hypothetical protein
VNPGHKKFYEFVGFKAIGRVKSYSRICYDPVRLMYWDLRTLEDRWKSIDDNQETTESFLKGFVITKNPYIHLTPIWDSLAKKEIKRVREAYNFYIKCPELFYDSSPYELKAIRQNLGDSLFSKLEHALHALEKCS